MSSIRQLDDVETRVLGALLEKEQATPDYYPLTVSALIAACNQKTNRDPVTALTETEVVETLERLRADVLVWRSEGARAERWSQAVSRRLELDRQTKALLTLLLLRGPQTPGELRSRCDRLCSFETLDDVQSALDRLAAHEPPLAAELTRAPGQKEPRWAHRLSPHAQPALAEPPVAAATHAPVPRTPGLAERLDALERQVAEIAADLARLGQRLSD